MSLQNTPAAERVHIAFFGVRNAGKSSLVNAVTGQALSIVSDVAGTTTDPVHKTMELLPIGPVVIIDTPGIDDVGELGEERVRRTRRILDKTDLAVLVTDATRELVPSETELLQLFKTRRIPHLIAANKADLLSTETEPPHTDPLSLDALAAVLSSVPSGQSQSTGGTLDLYVGDLSPSDNTSAFLYVSALTGLGIRELKEGLGRLAKEGASERSLVRDLVSPGDLVILVVPIDKSAPKGRLILPQQMVIRELLDAGAMPLLVRDTEYASLTKRKRPGDVNMEYAILSPTTPRLVITDSQVFESIAAQTPESIPLTSFSMLMARYKGGFEDAARGAEKLDDLHDGDTVLIAEGCTHHRQCEDIGTVKMPRWIERYTGKTLHYAFTSGGDFPEDLSPYALIIHCGGCMLNEREMRSRRRHAEEEGIPMTNYGIAIAKMHGILERAILILR